MLERSNPNTQDLLPVININHKKKTGLDKSHIRENKYQEVTKTLRALEDKNTAHKKAIKIYRSEPKAKDLQIGELLSQMPKHCVNEVLKDKASR